MTRYGDFDLHYDISIRQGIVTPVGNPSVLNDDSEVTLWVKKKAGKPEDLSSVPGTHGGTKEPTP